MRIADLKNKNVAIFGYGREGRAVLNAIRHLLPEQPLTILNDTPLEIERPPQTELYVGNDANKRLTDFDVLIKSPGVSLYRPELQSALVQGVTLTSQTRLWFAEHPEAKTICITGTKGKSTTSSLLAHVLNSVGIDTALGGNIGQALFDIPASPKPERWVIELSSYQCADFDGSPDISVLLNLFPEHLDWHGDVETYCHDKLNLLRQPAEQRVLNRQDKTGPKMLGWPDNAAYFNGDDGFHVTDNCVYDDSTLLFKAEQCQLRGEHNLSNICAVLTVARLLDIDPTHCIDALTTFEGLPHRLHILGKHAGLTYVDDSISTTPQSTLAAIQAFQASAVTVLVGGYDRGLDWQETAQHLASQPVNAVITMGDNGPRIAETLRQHGLTAIHEVDTLSEAVALAKGITPANGVVLLSPGSPSYGQFENFQARGRKFAVCAFDAE
ncbi:MAG: UDP-N-acetylmuramoyl-L-alanine--D-glutamate ligase [Pseudomonadota bacterium]